CDSLASNRLGDERNCGAAGAADQHRIAPQDGRHRGGEDRGEDPQHRRQPHEGCHSKAIRKGDQRRNGTAGVGASRFGPTIPGATEHTIRAQAAKVQAITFRKAVLNLSISSCVPTETRTYVGMLDHTRPMYTFSFRIAMMTSSPGFFTLTINLLDT